MPEPGFDKTVFVIMPFGEEGTDDREQNDDTYENIIKVAVASSGLGLDCVRSDDICVPGGVMEDVISYTVKSRYVIADLSDRNSNVFYELGIRDSFDGRTILLCNKNQKLPFDLKDMRTVFYTKELLKESSKAIEKIRTYLQNMEGSHDPIPSPVRKVLGTYSHPDLVSQSDLMPPTPIDETVTTGKLEQRMLKRLWLSLQLQELHPCEISGFPSEFRYWADDNLGTLQPVHHAVAVYCASVDFDTRWSEYKVDLLRLVACIAYGRSIKNLRVIFAIYAELDKLQERMVELSKLVIQNYGSGVFVQPEFCSEAQLQAEESIHSKYGRPGISFEFFDLCAERKLEEKMGIKK